MIKIREAMPGDLPDLVDLARAATDESSYNIEFDQFQAAAYIQSVLWDNDFGVLLAYDGPRVVGVVQLASSLEYHTKPFCYVMKFWVLPTARRTDAARQLAEKTLDWAQVHGCSHIFVTATAEIDPREQRLFINLMRRQGFVDGGPVLHKEL